MEHTINIQIKGLDTLSESIALLAAALAKDVDMYNPDKFKPEPKEDIGPKQVTINDVTSAPTQSIPTQPADNNNYTLDMLAQAAINLRDSKKISPEVLPQILAKFGVDALPSLDRVHYPAFAQELRSLGADI